MSKSKVLFLGFISILSLYRVAVGQESQSDRAFRYAERLYEDQLYDVAAEQYQLYLSEFPRGSHRPDAALNLGKSRFQLKQYDQARKAFQQVDLDFPGTSQAEEALWMVGEAYEQMGEWEEAARAFRRLYVYYPESNRAARGLVRGAQDAQKAENYQLAEAELQSVIENFYTSEEANSARIQLAQVYQTEHRYQLAWNTLDKALNASPTKEQRGNILLEQAITAEHLFSRERAMDIYGKILDEYRRGSIAERASLEQGRLALTQQNYPLATDLLDKAVDADAQDVKLKALEYRGDLAWYQHAYQDAAQYYSQALGLDPEPSTTARLQLKRAMSLRKNGEQADAYEQLRSISFTTDDSLHNIQKITYRQLAEIAVDLERYREAVGVYRQLMPLENRDARAEITMQLGDLYLNHLNDYRAATNAFRTVIDSFANSPEVDNALFSLGKVYESQQDNGKALETYTRLVEQYPFTDLYTQAQQRIKYLEQSGANSKQVSFQHLANLFGQLLLRKNPSDLYFRLGILYFNDQKNYQAAIQQFQQLTQEDISAGLRDSVRYYLGRSYENLATEAVYSGEQDQAAAYAGKAIAYFDSLTANQSLPTGLRREVLLRTGKLYAQVDNDQAVSYFSNLAKQYPNDPEITLEYARALNQAGQGSFALTVLEPALKNAEQQPEYEQMLQLAATLAYNQNQRGLAETFYGDYLTTYPFGFAGARARWVLLEYALADSNYTDALKYAESLRQEGYYTGYSSLLDDRIGQIYLQAGEYRKAANWFAGLASRTVAEDAIFTGRDRAENVEAQYWAGEAFDELGQTTDAAGYFQAYIYNGTNQAHLASAHEALGDLAASMGEYEQARSHYQQAVDLMSVAGGEAITMQKHAAEMAMELEDYQAAASEYLAAAEAASSGLKKDLWQQGIIALIRSEQTGKANSEARKFTDAFNLKRDDLALKHFEYERAKNLAAQKKFRQARTKLEAIIDDNLPADFAAKVKYELGREYVITNEYEQAVDLLTKITVDYPKSDVLARVYVTLGTVYYEQEQPQLAIEAFRNALDYTSETQYRQAAMRNLIKLYDENGLSDAAAAMARDYVAQYPDAKDRFSIRIQIGTFLMRMHEYDRAIDHLTSLLREADAASASEIQFWIAECYFNQNQYERAIAEYLKIPYMNPPTKLDWAASAMWKAGNAYERLGKTDKAIQLYERIIRDKGASSNFGRFARRRIDELKSGDSATTG